MDDLISRQAAIDALKKQREELLKGLDKNSNVYGIISASTGIVICTVGQLPSAQPTFDARDTQYNLPIGTDLISRQAAIDEIDEWIKAFRESGHKQSAADARLIQDGIIQLPSAQHEIIRCRNCKFASGDSRICMKFGHGPIGEFDFCSWAERRTDG